jgi:hypothetical protein
MEEGIGGLGCWVSELASSMYPLRSHWFNSACSLPFLCAAARPPQTKASGHLRGGIEHASQSVPIPIDLNVRKSDSTFRERNNRRTDNYQEDR